jgi:nicotinate-nucleotide adenylyltransferase
VRIIGNQAPGADLIYLIGGDSLRDLLTWRNPRQLVAMCAILGIMHRPGDAVDLVALETQLPGLSEKVRFIEAPLIDISASDIRRRVAEDKPYRYFLPQEVYAIIQGRQLYRGKNRFSRPSQSGQAAPDFD